MVGLRLLVLSAMCWLAHGRGSRYRARVLSKTLGMSRALPVGAGHSPCEFTFNPAWIPDDIDGTQGGGRDPGHHMIVRAANCPDGWGGALDHLMMARCYDDGHCDDLENVTLPLEQQAEDPRVVRYKGWVYLFYYASGDGLNTVYLRRTQDPANVSSWELLAPPFPWHRNGCLLLRETPPHYCIYGESPPLAGLGLAKTDNLVTFVTVNASFLEPNGASDPSEPEVVVEASTPVVQLSTGDYFHVYSAGTPGWVPRGNYTGGWIILDRKDPTVIVQRSAHHLLVASEPWEIGNGPYPVQRHRTIFATSIIPVAGQKDTFRVWYGASDANVASAVIKITHD